MTVSFRKNANDVGRELVYLTTKTLLGRLVLALMLLGSINVPATHFFSAPPGSRAEHFAVIAFLPILAATYALLALITLSSIYLSAWLTPPISVTIDHERCYTTSFFSAKTPWRRFQRMTEKPDFFCFLGGGNTTLISKHAFASRAEADLFFHTALTYWHEAKGTVPPPPPAPPDPSGVWPPAPQTAAAQEPGAAEAR